MTFLKEIKYAWKEFSGLSMEEAPQVGESRRKKITVWLENMSIHISY